MVFVLLVLIIRLLCSNFDQFFSGHTVPIKFSLIGFIFHHSLLLYVVNSAIRLIGIHIVGSEFHLTEFLV